MKKNFKILFILSIIMITLVGCDSDLHKHNYKKDIIEATCTEDGYTIYACDCGDVYIDNKIDALGHKEIIDENVVPSCANEGLTEGSHCSVCNEIIIAQDIISKTAHNYVWEIIKEPNERENGLEIGTCINCDDKKEYDIKIYDKYLEYSLIDNEYYVVTGYNDNLLPQTTLIISETYRGLPVKGIGKRAFAYCVKLKEVIIPDSVIEIGEETFYKCTALREVKLSNSITSIDDATFSNCLRLENIIIPNGVKYIADSAFISCELLKNITIPESVTNIGNSVFYGCVSMAEIRISDSVTEIGDYTFGGCIVLNEVKLPQNVTKIGKGMFENCKLISSIELPPNIKMINDRAFYNCNNLLSINIPNSVTDIGKEAFKYCLKLESVIIPEGITVINEETFYRCEQLKNVTFPETLTRIEDYAFADCKIGNINIPKKLNYIGSGAFSNGLYSQKIIIPKSVTYVGSMAFRDCPSLTIYIELSKSESAEWNQYWNYNKHPIVWSYTEE